MGQIRPLLISDSRGKEIQQRLQKKGYPALVLVYPGKGIQLSTLAAIPKITEYNPNVITLVGSICDITYKHHKEPKIRLRYEKVDELVKFYISQLKESISMIKTLRPNIQIQATTVIGLDLTDANTRGLRHKTGKDRHDYYQNKTQHPQQHIVDTAVNIINKEIAAINISNDIATPWTANAIHFHKGKGKFVAKYDRLTDGCHLGEKAKENWVNQLVLSYKKIHAKWFGAD